MSPLRLHRVAAAVLFLLPGAAVAGGNDFELWRLHNPQGEPAAQTRFARLANALALSVIPSFGEPAATTGQAGLELGFTTSVALPKLQADEWPGAASSTPPQLWVLPTVRVRKGLGGSLEVGTAVSMLAGSQVVALSAEVRWAPLDGIDYVPDVALRAWGTRVLGTQELDLALAGGDVTLSKSFGLGGMVSLQPYGQYGMALVNVSSGVIDFDPANEDPKNPTADDGVFRAISMLKNTYHRFAVGLRLVAGVAVVGVEWTVAFGTNPVQTEGLAAGAVAPAQFTRQMSGTAQLGVKF